MDETRRAEAFRLAALVSAPHKEHKRVGSALRFDMPAPHSPSSPRSPVDAGSPRSPRSPLSSPRDALAIAKRGLDRARAAAESASPRSESQRQDLLDEWAAALALHEGKLTAMADADATALVLEHRSALARARGERQTH